MAAWQTVTSVLWAQYSPSDREVAVPANISRGVSAGGWRREVAPVKSDYEINSPTGRNPKLSGGRGLLQDHRSGSMWWLVLGNQSLILVGRCLLVVVRWVPGVGGSATILY